MKIIAIGVMCAAGAKALAAQRTVTETAPVVTATATIVRVDAAQRFIVLRDDDDGSEVGIFAPLEFGRFDELRVGDRVTFKYYESIVYRIRPVRSAKPGANEEVAATESKGSLPGATLSHQVVETVTVRAVDRKAPSITVLTKDGQIVSRKVENGSLLEGLTPGDRIEITYTEALLATVTNAK